MPKPYTTYVSTLFSVLLHEVQSTHSVVELKEPITPYIQNRLLTKAKEYDRETQYLLIQSILSAEVR